MHKDISEGKWKSLREQGKEWGGQSIDADLLTHPDIFHYVMTKEWWGQSTDNDLDRVGGKYNRFVGLIQEKYRDTHEHDKVVQSTPPVAAR